MPPKLSLHGEGDAYSQVMAATLPGDGGLGAKWVTLFPQNAAARSADHQRAGRAERPGDRPAGGGDGRGGDHRLAHRRERRRRGRLPGAPDVACAGVLGCGVQARAAVRALAAVLPELRGGALPRRRRGRRRRVRGRAGRRASGRRLRAVSGAGRRRARRRRRRHGDHDDGGDPAAARLRAARARGAGGGARLRRRLERGGHGGVRPVLLRRHGDRAGHAGGRRAARRHPRGDRRGPRRAGRRPASPAARGADERLFCLNLGMALEDVVTGELALRRARELGVGRELPL